MIVQPKENKPVMLSSLLATEGNRITGKIVIRSCGTDPNERLKNGLFVCLAEDADSADEQITQAIKQGASVAVVREGLFHGQQPLSGYVFEVEEPLEVFGRACQALLDNPGSKLKLIGITGTSGKTSLSYVIAGVLAESGSPVGLIGSLGTYNGKSLVPESETTPRADRLALRLAEMVDNGCTHAIIEVSSEAIDRHHLDGLIFDAICLTNIRRDHLDYHRSLEQYRKTKMRVFDYADANTLVVCNADDRVTGAILHLIPCPTITVGLHPSETMVSGMLVEQNRSGQTFYVVAGIDAVPIRTRIIGTEHIYNSLFAAALAMCWELDLKKIVPGIERVEHIPGRLEQIDCGQPFAVFVDNASTPESLEATLKTIQAVSTGKIYCVLGIPQGKDRSKRPLMGRKAETHSDVVAITSGSFAETANEEAVTDILQGFDCRDRNVRSWAKRKDAIVWALSDAGPEDTVLIIGSGAAEDRPDEIISDRQFVRNWLYENQPCLEPFWY